MIDVVMPQMGESITEGTLTRWLKKPGEKVERDEPLFEISTDKVDTEIPSPVAGEASKERLRIVVLWPAPAPHAPLYIWLRGETTGRLTSTKF